MPKVGRTFMAKGGTVFVWYVDDPNTDVEIMVPASRVSVPSGMAQFSDFLYGENPNAITHVPGADLDEFIAHVLSTAVDETCEVLMFPSLRPDPKSIPPKDAA